MNRKSGKTWVVILVLIALAGALYYTNPPVEKHRAALARKIQSAAEKEGGLAGAVQSLAALDLVVRAMPLTYHDYYLVSTLQEGEKWVTLGIFGAVVVRNRE